MTRIRTALGLVPACAVIVSLVLVTAAGARVSAGGADQFTVIGGDEIAGTSYKPLALDTTPVTVVVQLSGRSVAEHRAADPDHTLPAETEAQIAAELKARQDALKSSIAAAGGEVLGAFQYAINGIKVRIARNKVQELLKLPNVIRANAVNRVYPDNTNGVPLVNAPAAWNGAGGFRGEHVRVAIIDTGIDYTHADFGGPGTPAAYDEADATDTAPANPAWFGPMAPKVKGGIDLVGDDYNASSDDPAELTPKPDPNPLDCNGHGTHVAGTAAGFGVTSDGKTYKGPYTPATISSNTWNVGPGTAPLADLYAVRVFGCEGSTDVTVEAIEWSVANHMQVINMSLGSPFGRAEDPSSVAADNAAKSGVIVVASAGNSGPAQYITGSPAAGNAVLSVAANDPTAAFPGAVMVLSTGQTITAINANGASFAPGTTYNIKVIKDDPATPTVNEALGCNPSDFGTLGPNTMAVVLRGVCARVAKAINGQKSGAAAVTMVNTSASLPPFEGKITRNPDTGEEYTVTIPFFGVRGGSPPPPTSDGGKLLAADGGTAQVTPTTIPNPNFKGFADFTSGGPRNGDSWLKPEITAPGVSIASASVGTGSEAQILSGTSMAAPHVAGIAALVRQSKPNWHDAEDLKAALVNTADPAGVAGTTGYRISRGGTGLAQADKATKTQAVASQGHSTAVNFGFIETTSDISRSQWMYVRNYGSSAMTFGVSATNAQGSPHTVGFNATSVSVPAGGTSWVRVDLTVPAATIGDSTAFREVAGLITFTPAAGQNNDIALRVPYYMVPRAIAHMGTTVSPSTVPSSSPTTTATVTNSSSSAIPGDADFYAWGLEDPNDQAHGAHDVRAIGLQSFPSPTAADPNRRLLVFAVNTWERWSNAAVNEFDILVDVDSDGKDDYVVVGVDLGAITTGSFNGQMAVAVFSTRSAGASIAFLAVAPTDSSTALLPVRTSQLCRTGEPCLSMATNPRLRYGAISFDLELGGEDEVTGTARFNAWSPSISNGMFVENLPPGGSAAVPVTLNPAEWAQTPAKGLMVVEHDDYAGEAESDLVPITLGG